MFKKSSDKKTRLGVNCGSCIHYDKVRSHNFDDVCVKLGVREKANAPDCYNPDFYRLAKTSDPDVIGKLAEAMKELRPSQMRVLAFTLTRGSKMIEKHGLRFGQKVYFTLGKDFLSHYFMGYVIGANEENIILSSKLKKCKTNTVCQLGRDSLLTRKEWKVKKKELRTAGKVFMTDEDKRFHAKLPLAELLDENGHFPITVPEEFDYEPPTIDTDPERLESYLKKEKGKNKKKKYEKGYIPIVNIEDIPIRSKKKDKDSFGFDSEEFMKEREKKSKSKKKGAKRK